MGIPDQTKGPSQLPDGVLQVAGAQHNGAGSEFLKDPGGAAARTAQL